MKNKLFYLLICVLALFILSSCKTEKSEKPVDTTQKIVELIPHDTVLVPNPDWGYEAKSVGVSDPNMIGATLKENGDVEIVSYNSGSAQVFVYDCFGHKAIIEVEVADNEDKNISYTANPCVEEYVDAADFGALPGSNCNKGLQAAIDYVHKKGGGTVYLYPGIYLAGGQIVMRENVTLEMCSGFTDATLGLTDELSYAIRHGEVTVLRGALFLNNEAYNYATDGASNFTIRGGVIDADGSIIFSLAENVLIENLIIKDRLGNHMVQISGGKNIEFRNCMFVGIDYKGFTYEAIQIEPTRPNAHGVHIMREGEFYCPESITINSCYFGPSEKRPAPHIAVGHHGTSYDYTCKDLKIVNNVFDRCTYAAIRSANIVDVDISGNKFIATKKSNKVCEEANPAFIHIYSTSGSVKYDNIVDQRTVTKAFAEEVSGTHRLNIFDNEFIVEQGSDKRIIIVSGSKYAPGAVFKSNILRQDTFSSTPYTLSGYFRSTNYVSNISFCKNKITYTGVPNVSNYIFYFTKVYGLVFENNEIDLQNGCKFSYKMNSVSGLYINACYNDSTAKTLEIISDKTTKYIRLPKADGTSLDLKSNGICVFRLVAVDGGTVKLRATTNGDIIISVVADEGYVFSGWVDSAGNEFNKTTISNSTIRAIFEKA